MKSLSRNNVFFCSFLFVFFTDTYWDNFYENNLKRPELSLLRPMQFLTL